MFDILTDKEMQSVDGGFLITGAMIATGIGCLGGGVAFGYAIGKIIRYFKNR